MNKNFTHNKHHAVHYFFVSIMENYYLYQYYFSLMLQYSSKECVQGSKACLYVGFLQALKSIMARWF
jgi:hypothetical protein